ncbi:hypothetical protein YB2330_001430 [Saitoella coloradoensis]
MGLVDYGSDSDDEEVHQQPAAKSSGLGSMLPPPKKASGLVSMLPPPKKGGPRKIIVDLPDVSKGDIEDIGEPAQKKPRIGGGATGLSALLPAPKRAPAATAPAPPSKDFSSTEVPKNIEQDKRSTPFRTTMPALAPRQIKSGYATPKPKPKVPAPSVPLFSLPTLPTEDRNTRTFDASSYEPIIATMPLPKPSLAPTASPILADTAPAPVPVDSNDMYAPSASNDLYPNQGAAAYTNHNPQAGGHAQMASQLGVDEAILEKYEGRRRKGQKPITANIIDYNVEEQYNLNEELLRTGQLQPQTQPVRAIASGRHQLSSLVNAAHSQKESLEEHFAQGRKNKSEGGQKYGW